MSDYKQKLEKVEEGIKYTKYEETINIIKEEVMTDEEFKNRINQLCEQKEQIQTELNELNIKLIAINELLDASGRLELNEEVEEVNEESEVEEEKEEEVNE